MAKRSNLIVVLGVVVFIIGASATYLISRSGDDDVTAGEGQVSVLFAERDIPAGTTGTDAVSSGAVRSRAVAATAAPADAVTDQSQLAGLVTVLGVAEGQTLRLSQFREAQTRIGTLEIPEGRTAMAVQMANVPGVAGFAGAGDRINVYGLIRPDGAFPAGAARLIMQGIEVLNVNGTTLAGTQGQPGAPGLVFLLAVTPAEAERLAYLTSFQQLYFSLIAADTQPVAPSPGTNLDNVLEDR